MKINPIKNLLSAGKIPAYIFDYIEMFYNSKCRHGLRHQMPLTEYEQPYY
ncbi:hypothetical protein PEC331060_07780 [Pectobacterium carotovorum subsp. carotovorum]|nr:hypothetical protein PEC331060_07780 [Pectobacterium carotovorum subsp. carotovorum]